MANAIAAEPILHAGYRSSPHGVAGSHSWLGKSRRRGQRFVAQTWSTACFLIRLLRNEHYL